MEEQKVKKTGIFGLNLVSFGFWGTCLMFGLVSGLGLRNQFIEFSKKMGFLSHHLEKNFNGQVQEAKKGPKYISRFPNKLRPHS